MSAEGAYIEADHLLAALTADDLVRLTDDAGTGQRDDAVLDAVIARAEGELNSYVARRHTVPLDLTANDEMAEAVRGKCIDLAAYYLRCRRPGMPQELRDRYLDAVRWLRDVAAGKVTLGGVPEPPASGLGGTHVAHGGETRQMTRDNMQGL